MLNELLFGEPSDQLISSRAADIAIFKSQHGFLGQLKSADKP